MLPKVVHHKQNGHTHTPTAQSRGDVIRAVHSVPAQGPSVTASLLRFASIVSSERAAALLADVTRHVDGVEMALTAALAKTRMDIDRGGFTDVREQLDGLRAHVERTARMVNRLIAAAEQDARGATLIDVNALVVAALEGVRARRDTGVAVVMRLAPGLPSVPGQPAALLGAVRDALSLVDAADTLARDTFTVETATVTPAMVGEPIVRIRITAGPLAPATAAQLEHEAILADASRIVAEHGGIMSVAVGDGAALTITVDLPGL